VGEERGKVFFSLGRERTYLLFWGTRNLKRGEKEGGRFIYFLGGREGGGGERYNSDFHERV